MSFINAKNIFTIGNKIKDFFLPTDLTATPEAFKKTQLRALADRKTISKLLFYRSYMVDKESDLGFFQMHDGRAGIAFVVNPPVYLTEKTENVILNVLSSIVKDDTIVHISMLAGRDVKNKIDNFKSQSKIDKLNIRHPEKLREIIDNKADSFEKWTNESIMGQDSDLRVRNFTHIISVLFPVGLNRDSVVKQSNEIYGVLKQDFAAKVADDDDMVAFVQEILNPAKGTYDRTGDPVTTLSKRMAKGATVQAEDDGLLKLNDGWMAKVLTTEKYPKAVDSFGFQSIFFDPFGNDAQIKLPCPFFLSLCVRFTDVEKQRKRVLKKAQWNLGQLSPLPSIIEKKKPEIKDRRKESESVIHYIENLGEIPLDAEMSLTIFEDDHNRLEQYTSLIKNSFGTFPGRWIMREETFGNIGFYTTLMGLPLNYSPAIHNVIDKFDKNFKSNNAQIAPLIGDFKGMGKNNTHMYIGRTGQLVPLDIFASEENYNVVVVGPMGTGKSFWTNNFLVSGVRGGWDARMIDFGRSYAKSSEAIGGQFIEFDRASKICMNFFTHLQTVVSVEDGIEKHVIDPDELEAIVPIVGLMMGVSLKEIYKSSDSSSEKLDLSVMATFVVSAVKIAFDRHGHEAGMKEVGEILDEIRKNKNEYNHNVMTDEVEILTKMVTSLESYTKPGGQYFKYFNGVNNINLDSSFFTLELDDISSSPMMPVVAMSFLQRTAQEAFVGYLKDKSKARIIGVDEAHKILGNEIFAKFFDDFGRRIRKYRGIPMLITQSLEDFNVNQSAKIFFELASFKVLLRQKSESVEKATRQAYFQANAFQQKLINSINIKKPHYNEFYLRHNNLDMVLLLKVNADEYWTYTTDPLDRSKIDDVMNKYDIPLLDALWVLARLSDGMDIDKALYELTKKAGRKGTKDWDEFFKYTIENKSVFIARQNVLHDNKKDIPKYQELFMRIKDKNGVLHNPGVFLQAAQEKEYYEEIGKLFLDNVCEYIIRDSVLNPELIYSINIDNVDIQSDSFIQNLFTVIGRLGKERNKLLLELKLDHLTKTNFDKVLSFARRAKKMGVLIGFDNVLLKQTDFYSLISLSPKLFKIDIQSLLEIDDFERKMLKNYIAVLVQAADISVIATKLEEDEQLEEAKTFGIDLFQGWIISKTENI